MGRASLVTERTQAAILCSGNRVSLRQRTDMLGPKAEMVLTDVICFFPTKSALSEGAGIFMDVFINSQIIFCKELCQFMLPPSHHDYDTQ